MSATDLGIAVAVLGWAGFVLYRSLWKRRGACPGCATGCAAPPRGGEPLVALGRRRRGC